MPKASQQIAVIDEPDRRVGAPMRLDDATIAKKIQLYPPEIVEPVQWLAGYVREKLDSRRDLLAELVHRLGLGDVTDNYFYQVLTGRYFGRDKITGKLMGSPERLAKIIAKLREHALQEERSGATPFIETSTYRQIADRFDAIRAPGTICKFTVIIGPTGHQKSRSAKHYSALNNHGLCKHLETSPFSSLSHSVTDLAMAYGNSKWGNLEAKMEQVRENVTSSKMIVWDNVQRLYVRGRRGNQPFFSFVQKLQDDTDCAIGFLLAKDRADFLISGLEEGFFEQFEGRAGGRDNFLILPDYTPREDLVQIGASYGLSLTDHDEDPVTNYLDMLARKPGRCRILFHWLQEAKRAAIAMKTDMSLDLIKHVRGEVA